MGVQSKNTSAKKDNEGGIKLSTGIPRFESWHAVSEVAERNTTLVFMIWQRVHTYQAAVCWFQGCIAHHGGLAYGLQTARWASLLQCVVACWYSVCSYYLTKTLFSTQTLRSLLHTAWGFPLLNFLGKLITRILIIRKKQVNTVQYHIFCSICKENKNPHITSEKPNPSSSLGFNYLYH